MPPCLKRILALLGFCATLFAQIMLPGRPETGTVEGDVTDSVTHQPIAGARVKLQAGSRTLFAMCAEDGRFQFREVPLDSYTLAADRPGYASGGQSGHARLSSGNTQAQVHLSLRPYAVVAGRILDSAGVPMEGVTVDLLQLRPIDARQSNPPGISPRGAITGDREMSAVARATTNDLGEYRFASRNAGTYYVRAHPIWNRNESDETERVTYYPSALRAAAARPIAVSTGQEVPGIDVHMIRQAGVRIAGRVVQPADSPKARSMSVNTNVAAWRLDAPEAEEALLPSYAANGAFDLKNFLPGKYVVEATTTDQTDFGHPRTLLAGRRTIEVRDTDVEGIDITTQPPVDIHGAVVFVEGCPAVPVSVAPKVFSRLVTMAPQDAAAATGTFTLSGLIPGSYTLTIRPLPTGANSKYRYSVASASLGEREALGDGFEIAGQPPGELRISISCSQPRVAPEVAR